MQKNAQADAKNILAEKIHAFLISESEHGRYKFKAPFAGIFSGEVRFFPVWIVRDIADHAAWTDHLHGAYQRAYR